MSTKSVSESGIASLSEVIPQFLCYARAELGFAPQTISKYSDCLRQVTRMIGDLPVTHYVKPSVLALKSAMLAKNHSAGRQISILAAFKGLLRYCAKELNLPVLAPESITLPKRPRREVVYLTTSEVETFVSAIDLTNRNDKPFEAGLRFRALVEALLGSGVRISELLSLNRADVDYQQP